MARKISCRIIASLTLGFLVWSSSLFAGERPTEINALDYPFDSESFIPLKLTTDPYFLKGVKAGRSNGLKHSALLICGGESLALGTDLEWAKPEENPYLFGYFLGYLQVFEAARTRLFVDCSAQSGSDLATGIVSAYEKLHEAIQNAIDALSAQCRIAGLQ
ncbi:MAG: hypothetical protein M3Q07_06090, partial [Pseudobdellovibrionaceae bacterium]|nr:hypothetical protein [Pseudobdellovibrionaceae bacterium]